MSQFTVTIDENGNLLCEGGCVIDLSAGTTEYTVIGGMPQTALNYQFGIRYAARGNSIFMGGGGGNVLSSGTVTGTLAPIGWFRRIDVDTWVDPIGNELVADYGTGTAEILSGANVIADCASIGTLAPTGVFTATTYGEDTYNGGSAFTLTLTDDGAQVISTAVVTFRAGTAQSGVYALTEWHEWTSNDDSDFVLTTNTDGTAQISDASDVIAERSSAFADDPSGTYIATTYGQDTYNEGEFFIADVQLDPVSPRIGYVYVQLTLSSGTLTAVSELIFDTSLPANSATLEVVPIAYSDGNGSVIQIQQGPIIFR
jgi:hypothetical protein